MGMKQVEERKTQHNKGENMTKEEAKKLKEIVLLLDDIFEKICKVENKCDSHHNMPLSHASSAVITVMHRIDQKLRKHKFMEGVAGLFNIEPYKDWQYRQKTEGGTK